MGSCRDQADNQYRNISSNTGTRSYKRCNSGYKNSYNRQHQQHGQETTNFLDFQHTTVPQIVHAPNIFSFSGYQCATMIPLYPPNSLSFSGLHLIIPLFRWSMKISIKPALNLWSEKMIDICYCKYVYTNANLSFSSIQCYGGWQYQVTHWYASNIAVNILNATQLEARECYSGQHAIQSWVTTELSACHNTSLIGSPLLY